MKKAIRFSLASLRNPSAFIDEPPTLEEVEASEYMQGYRKGLKDAAEQLWPYLAASRAKKAQTRVAALTRAIDKMESAERKHAQILKRAESFSAIGRAPHELAGLIVKEGYSRRVVDRVLKPMRDELKKSRR